MSDDDVGYTYDEWRLEWVNDNMPWRGSSPQPDDWNPVEQVRVVREE